MMSADADAARIEEAGLNALQTQRQLFFDGWLLRLSPGKAKRARSVNAHFGSSLPLDAKIDRCERLYAAHRLPALFRITPWSKPHDLEAALERRGYVAFDETRVQVARTAPADGTPRVHGIELAGVPIAAFVEAVGELRGSPIEARNAHLERLVHSPLATHAIVARAAGRTLACGQMAFDGDLAGIYDMVTANECRGRGLATAIVGALLANARERGVDRAFLQVSDDNAAALAVYRKFGFATAYTYRYRARVGECE
jgi:ribosomal protein S18 acetylase RimI-like enzyme